MSLNIFNITKQIINLGITNNLNNTSITNFNESIIKNKNLIEKCNSLRNLVNVSKINLSKPHFNNDIFKKITDYDKTLLDNNNVYTELINEIDIINDPSNIYLDINFTPITPQLINLIITHVTQYKERFGIDNMNFLDFGCGSGICGKILEEEFKKKNININIINYDIKIPEKNYDSNIITSFEYLLSKISCNDVLFISWGPVDNFIYYKYDASLYLRDINILIQHSKIKLIIIIGNEPNESTIPYNYFFNRSKEYITYIIDKNDKWSPIYIDEKISFNILND